MDASAGIECPSAPVLDPRAGGDEGADRRPCRLRPGLQARRGATWSVPFRESMSLKTVTGLSAEWHKAVQDTDGPQYTFPPPWYPGGPVAGYELVPLISSTDLYQEGRMMRNCVASYGERVVDGDCYIYSIRQNGERVATAEVVKGRDGKVDVGQVRNNCNRPAPEIEFVVREWLSRQAPGLDRAA